MTDTTKVYVADRPDTGEMDFTYNYSDAEWTAYLANHSLDYKG